MKLNETDYDKINKVIESLESHYTIQESLVEKKEELCLDEKAEKLISIFQKLKKKQKFDNILTSIGLLLLIVGILVLFWNDLKIHLIFFIRFIIVNMAYFFDFSSFYHSHCVLTNPHYVPEIRVKQSMCKYTCNEMNQKLFLQTYQTNKNFTKEDFKEIAYESNIPLVEISEISNWLINDTDNIFDVLLKDFDHLDDKDFCIFESSFNLKKNTFLSFLSKVTNENLNKYSAMWENCSKKSSKSFRKLFKRPEFLPASLEMSFQNWMFISKNYFHANFINVPLTQRIVLFCQIAGQSQIRLKPIDNCASICPKKKFNLERGKILIASDMFNIEFKPNTKKENAVLVLLAN